MRMRKDLAVAALGTEESVIVGMGRGVTLKKAVHSRRGAYECAAMARRRSVTRARSDKRAVFVRVTPPLAAAPSQDSTAPNTLQNYANFREGPCGWREGWFCGATWRVRSREIRQMGTPIGGPFEGLKTS